MSRAYIIYILMFVCFAGGMSLIFTVGGSLRAPDDLSGDWNLAWNGPPPPELGGDAKTMRIAQSGRFFFISFGGGRPISMTLDRGWKGAHDGFTLRMRLASNIWKFNLRGDVPLSRTAKVSQLSMDVDGPVVTSATATRKGFDSTTRPAGVAVAARTGHAR